MRDDNFVEFRVRGVILGRKWADKWDGIDVSRVARCMSTGPESICWDVHKVDSRTLRSVKS